MSPLDWHHEHGVVEAGEVDGAAVDDEEVVIHKAAVVLNATMQVLRVVAQANAAPYTVGCNVIELASCVCNMHAYQCLAGRNLRLQSPYSSRRRRTSSQAPQRVMHASEPTALRQWSPPPSKFVMLRLKSE